IARHFAEKAGCMERRCLRRTHDDMLCRLCNDCRDEEDQNRDNYLRQITEDDLTDEEIHGRQMEYIKRCHQENDDEEPLNEEAEKSTGGKLVARAGKDPLN